MKTIDLVWLQKHRNIQKHHQVHREEQCHAKLSRWLRELLSLRLISQWSTGNCFYAFTKCLTSAKFLSLTLPSYYGNFRYPSYADSKSLVSKPLTLFLLSGLMNCTPLFLMFGRLLQPLSLSIRTLSWLMLLSPDSNATWPAWGWISRCITKWWNFGISSLSSLTSLLSLFASVSL